MEIANAATDFATTLGTVIPLALGVAIGAVVLYVFAIDYIRARNRTKMWRDL